MIRSFSSAASGLVAQSIRQDIIADNIANAQTPGFKRSRVTARSFSSTLEESMSLIKRAQDPKYPNSPVQPVNAYIEQAVDNSQGHMQQTGNKTDFAIDGPGAFEVVTGNGTRLTRAGNFMLNSDGELCTNEHEKVLGENGVIQITGKEWEVAEDGSVSVNGQIIDKLKIVGAADGETRICHKCLENANFNIVQEMVQMITNIRSFEANQKVVSYSDQTLEKLINEAGRV